MKALLHIAALATAWTASAQGTFEAMLDFSGGVGGYVNGTAGWTFQPTTQVAVTALGCFDYLLTIPTQGSILVGLWDSNGSLLASSAPALGSDLVNQSRYESINPVYLNPAETYHLGAYSTSGTLLLTAANPAEFGGFILLSPEIQLRGFAAGFGAFVFPPELAGSSGTAALAPNFQYVVVPEPSSLALLFLGGLLAVVRWNTK